MKYFEGRDLEIISNLTYDPTLEPAYDVIRGALVWADERADDLTPDGYEKLGLLWGARSFIHRNEPFSSCPFDPTFFQEVWTSAIRQGFSWPGFKRLELSQKDRDFLTKEEKALADGDY